MKAKMVLSLLFAMALILVFFCTDARAIRLQGYLKGSTSLARPEGVTGTGPADLTARLARITGTNGTCDTPVPVTNTGNIPGDFESHVYIILPQTTGCATVTFYGLGREYQVAAYSSFNPANIKANMLGHSRNSVVNRSDKQFFSFGVTAGVEYRIVVWNIEETDVNIHYDIRISESLAAPSDFDGDGYTDSAVFRPSNGAWFILNSSDGTVRVDFYGLNGDVPLDGDFDGDGRSDLAVFRPSNGTWYYHRSYNGTDYGAFFGLGTDTPVPGDHDKDGVTDIAAFRPATGQWFVSPSASNHSTVYGYNFGAPGDIPISSQRK
jgi:hypothetical protein